MITKPFGVKKYHTAYDRFLKPAIVNFFTSEFSGYFGPMVRENIADALIELFEKNAPQAIHLKHGQVLWNALDKDTRASSPKRRYKPVVLTLVDPQDIALFEKREDIQKIRAQVIARITKEAYQQGGILSMRDISLFMCSSDSTISGARIEYEQNNNVILPHTGSLHDMGTTLTHKEQIVFKHVVQKKPTHVVAKETNHSQKAVDRYIRDYNRVRILTLESKDIQYINLTTNIAKYVIRQYQDIINKYVKER